MSLGNVGAITRVIFFFPAGAFRWTPSLSSGFDASSIRNHFAGSLFSFSLPRLSSQRKPQEDECWIDFNSVSLAWRKNRRDLRQQPHTILSSCNPTRIVNLSKKLVRFRPKSWKFETKISKGEPVFNFDFLFSYLVAGGECHRHNNTHVPCISLIILCTLILYERRRNIRDLFRLRHVPCWHRRPATKEAIKKPKKIYKTRKKNNNKRFFQFLFFSLTCRAFSHVCSSIYIAYPTDAYSFFSFISVPRTQLNK